MREEVSEYTFPTDLWYGEGEVSVEFPENWTVEKYDMKGHKASTISKEDIRKAIEDPIGSRPIEEDAEGADSAVILFDDMTRPTDPKKVAPLVLEKLEEAGVPEDSIRFIMAQGAHRTHSRYDFAKKLGEDIIDNYPVFPHNPFHNCVRIDTTSFGTPVEINADFMDCDYKIGIGSIIPHPQCGYGGGGKIVVPGVSSMETIRKNHLLSITPRGELTSDAGWGCCDSNTHKQDVEEMVNMSGLDFKIDFLLNCKGQMTDIFSGDPIEEHNKGIRKAKKHYKTKKAKSVDIVIANAYCKANEAGLVISQVEDTLKKSGGTITSSY
ncbi:hypothetical protein AKJ49_01285 [candidate division MSBL1 archaeon SCGC-AAA382A03]|uniref:LarA-like N-terminal domain-containing protein n=1 Tax=candidate division MSBL1 archaeon SCGC-AAA382A03 TaxID=1698278 RepID=A0A133VFI6_9EURY|nr:hypothetical protein AKJ49_01285 [candidate division MSBL1 archaeon SCGC-AAA382A03]